MATDYGVLWDMDGVLVDTAELHFRTWLEALSTYDIPLTRESFRATFGMNNAGTLTALLGEAPSPELLAEIGERKERQFRQAIRGQVRPLPGVLPWLERLRSEGVRQAVASSAPPANIDVLLDELGLRPFFDVIGSGSDLPAKPDPSLFLQVARLIGVPPGRCVVVEDSVAGVQAARRAGMRCLAVTTTNPPHRLGEADVVVERLDELPEDAFRRLLALDLR
jgi:beta-phosphoglucomutase